MSLVSFFFFLLYYINVYFLLFFLVVVVVFVIIRLCWCAACCCWWCFCFLLCFSLMKLTKRSFYKLSLDYVDGLFLRWGKTMKKNKMIMHHDFAWSLFLFLSLCLSLFFKFVLHKLLILKFSCIYFSRSFLRKSKWIMLKFDQKRIYLLYLFFVEIKLIKKDELNVNKQTNKHVLMLDFHSLNTAVMWKLKYLCKKYLLKCI